MAISFGKQNSKLKTYGYPNFMLDFAKTKSLLESIDKNTPVTFTRASSVATYVDKDKLIKRSAVNLALYSEDIMSSWVTSGAFANWLSISRMANQFVSPDGKQTADLIYGTGSQKKISQRISVSPSTTYTFSIWIKVTNGAFVLDLASGNSNVLVTPSVAVSANIVSTDTPDWKRYSISYTVPSSGVNQLEIGVRTNSVALNEAYIWGVQLEEGSVATPYIKTTSTVCGAPRFDHDPVTGESLGLLVEEPRTNGLLYSEDFSNVYWTKGGSGTFTYNAEIAPDGTQTAMRMTDTRYVAKVNYPISAGVTYTTSCFIKDAGAGSIQFTSQIETGGYVQMVIDTTNWTVISNGFTNSPVITDFGNGWRRISMTETAAGTYTRVVSYWTSLGSGGTGVLLWGAQLEVGSFPTSYIPTEGSTVQRTADIASVEGADFSTTNLLSYSESFDVGWGTTSLRTVVANATTAPDGTLTADYIEQASGQTTSGTIFRYPTVSSSGTNVFSVYAKAAEKGWIRLHHNPSGGPFAYFNLTTCEVGTRGNGAISSAIENVGNGWCRVSMMYTHTTTTGLAIYVADADNSTTVTDSGGVYLWGASHTQTEYPVEYITTRNLLTDSQDFERWSASNSTVDDDATQAPDGTLTADRLVDTISSSTHFVQKSYSAASGTSITMSVYAKAAELNWIRLTANTATGANASAYFDLSSGTVGTIGGGTATISDAGNGWFKCSISGILSTTNPSSAILLASGDLVQSFAGTGSSGVYIWGAQLEPGTTATEYVRTTDVVGKKYNWYEPTEGTVFADSQSGGDLLQQTIAAFLTSTSSSANRMLELKFLQTTGNGACLYSNESGTHTSNAAMTTAYQGKIACGVKLDNARAAYDGTLSSLDTSVGVPTVGAFVIGKYRNQDFMLNGHIKRLLYWNTRKADSVLQGLTSGSWE